MSTAYTLTPKLSVGGASVLQATHETAVVRQLEAIEDQLASTWKNHDCAGWGALLADDWSVTHIDAQVITKAQALEMCRTGPPVTSTVDQLVVRAYGDTAIVTGRNKATVSGTAPQTVTLRFTDVFVRRDGRWIIVASHATRLAE
jgi:ketosteroid isomerase-like protein